MKRESKPQEMIEQQDASKENFVILLSAFVKKRLPRGFQLAALLGVSVHTIRSWMTGRRYPDNAVEIITTLEQCRIDFDSRKVISFKNRSGWTSSQIASQFNLNVQGFLARKTDVEQWLSIGLPDVRYAGPWKISQGSKPKTEAEFIKRRFVEMNAEVFSLQYVNHNGSWELETVEEFKQRLKKGPQKGKQK